MGVIQKAINQAVGTIGIATRIGANIKQNDIRMNEAMRKVAAKQETQKTQRRNFMDYLRRQPTSFGNTVADLPISTQKTLAKQYTSKERKIIMDQMDKEGKGGK